jgi:hypothetical protein
LQGFKKACTAWVKEKKKYIYPRLRGLARPRNNNTTTAMTKDRAYKLFGLFAAALLLFNFPLLNLFSKARLLGGLPLLYLYIFAAWALLVVMTRAVMQTHKTKLPR